MEELNKGDYEKVRQLTRDMEYNLILSAVIEGTSAGKVYVDDLRDPHTAFFCTVEGYYALGAASNSAFNQAINELILADFFGGNTLREDETVFALYYHPENWEKQMRTIFKGKHPIKEFRRHYLCKRVDVNWVDRVPSGFRLVRVDGEFLEETHLGNFCEVLGWINTNWNTIDEFLRIGRAYCLSHGDLIVSWCIADCVSGDLCEVGIHTDPEYRRQGLGTLTALACVADFLSSGYSAVGWHCSENNLGSRGVAEKVGFEQTHMYPIYYCHYDDAFQLALNGHFQLVCGNYHKALKWYDRALEFDYAPAWANYEAACALALLGEENSAFQHLYRAVERGWSNYDHTQQDEDLQSLHGTEAWNEFLNCFHSALNTDSSDNVEVYSE